MLERWHASRVSKFRLWGAGFNFRVWNEGLRVSVLSLGLGTGLVVGALAHILQQEVVGLRM